MANGGRREWGTMSEQDDRSGDGSGSVAQGGSRQPLLHQLARTLWSCKAAYDAHLGIGASATWVLTLLAERDGMTQHEMTRDMRVDPSMITRMIQDLERQRGWIRRERDPGDNRLVRVYLTEEGRRQTRDLPARLATLERQLTAGIAQETVDTLRLLLHQLEESARALSHGAPPITTSCLADEPHAHTESQ